MLDVLSVLFTNSMMNLGESSYCREIFRCELKNVLEFCACVLEPADLDQCAAECDMSGKI